MKEFVPEGTVNQSKKRREKKNLKKAKAREDEAFADIRKKAAEDANLRVMLKQGKNEGKFMSAIGKVLKVKTAPKKKVVDEHGSEWQVTETRKTVIAEESDSDNEVNSDSDDEIAFA